MIDLDAEGFVAISNNSIPLRNYLFYLTYNDRATAQNALSNVDLASKDIYKAAKDYNNKRFAESTVKNNQEKGEIIMSFSPRLCHLVVKHRFKGKIAAFKKDFQRVVNDIISKNLEQSEYAIFVHEYDSKQMRVHAHVLYYPYLEAESSIALPNGENQDLRPLKLWVEPEILANIKHEFNQYARHLYKDLEPFDKTLGEDFLPKKIERETLFNLIDTTPLRKPELNKEDLPNYWEVHEIRALSERLIDLTQTSDDEEIAGNKDFSIIVDYLYEFNDPVIYKQFFEHSALESIIKKFSVFKSNPKFSSVFLKLLSMTREKWIIDLIERKTRSQKGQELSNILEELYSAGSDSSQGMMATQKYKKVRTRNINE